MVSVIIMVTYNVGGGRSRGDVVGLIRVVFFSLDSIVIGNMRVRISWYFYFGIYHVQLLIRTLCTPPVLNPCSSHLHFQTNFRSWTLRICLCLYFRHYSATCRTWSHSHPRSHSHPLSHSDRHSHPHSDPHPHAYKASFHVIPLIAL